MEIRYLFTSDATVPFVRTAATALTQSFAAHTTLWGLVEAQRQHAQKIHPDNDTMLT